MATMKWVGALDPDIYRLAFHSNEVPPGRNRGRYLNSQLDPLLESGLLIADRKKRIDHYRKVQEIVHSDQPILPLWYDQEIVIYNRRIKNFSPDQTGSYLALIRVEKSSK